MPTERGAVIQARGNTRFLKGSAERFLFERLSSLAADESEVANWPLFRRLFVDSQYARA
jgi:hypothetical protein